MTPAVALEEQIKRYQAMTGEQRLQIALDLPWPARYERTGTAGGLFAPVKSERRDLLPDRLHGRQYYLHQWAHELGLTGELKRLLNGEIKPKST